jgi:serine/threonine-protein kinase PpkA
MSGTQPTASPACSVLVVEDDDALRNNVARLLRAEGYEVHVAADGTQGLARARDLRPDVVVSDVHMPGLDGFALVEALRADPALAATVVLMLTALDDRASMRRGMVAGADDYLAKPFGRVELLEALDGLVKKRQRIAGTIASAVRQAHAGADTQDVAEQLLTATVLFSDIRNFTAIAGRLDASEVAELLTHYFRRVSEPVLRQGGRHLKFIGDGLMAVFADPEHAMPLPAARRAVWAGLAVVLAAHEFRGWLEQRFADRGLPPFAIGVGLHAGEVSICRLGSAQEKETTPIGDTVNTASRLQDASKELGWTVVASAAVLRQAGEGVQEGDTTSIEVRGREGLLQVSEIVGLHASPHDLAQGVEVPSDRAEDIRRAVRLNSGITSGLVADGPRAVPSGGKAPT